MAGITVDALSRLMDANAASHAAAAENLQIIHKNISGVYNDAAAGEAAAGEAASLVTQTQALGLQKQEQAKIKVAQMLGVDVNSATEKISALSGALHAANAAQTEAANAIAEKKSVGLWDDPISYFMNSITINDDIRKYNAASIRAATAQNQIAGITKATKEVAELQFASTISDASIAAAAKVSAQQFERAAVQDRVAALNSNATAVRDALQADDRKLQLKISLSEAQHRAVVEANAADHLKLQQAADARENAKWQMTKEKMAQDENFTAGALNYVNIGRLARGLKPLDPRQATQLMGFLRAKGDIPAEFRADYTFGEEQQANGRGRFGSTPLEFIGQRAANVKHNLPPAAEEAYNAIHGKIIAELPNMKDTKTGQPIDQKDAAAVRAASIALANKTVEEFSTNPEGIAKNPYRIPALSTIIAAEPSLAKLPVVEKVFAPLIANGQKLDDAATNFSFVANAVAKGTITFGEAMSFAELMRKAMSANNEHRQFYRLGVREASSYPVSIDTNPGLFGGKATVDMVDTASMSRTLNTYLANAQFSTGFQTLWNAVVEPRATNPYPVKPPFSP